METTGQGVIFPPLPATVQQDGKESRMKTLADVHFEMSLRREVPPYETEREVLARIASASIPRRGQSSRIRRVAVRLGELASAVRCELESRFYTKPTATAC